MPTTYTHDIFGKEVFKRLPEEIKDTIRGGKGLYRIGLHGPDIFFYYHPVTNNPLVELGNKMHAEIAAPFFEQSVEQFRKKPSTGLASYLMGFACHYVLDSACHGYIGEYESKSGASHAEIETELDRYLMLRERKVLFSYLPAGVLEPTTANCKVIARLFPQIGYKLIQKSISSMKFFDKLLTCKTNLKEKIILNGMKVFHCYDSMEGQVMRKVPMERCRESTEHLMELYTGALEEAPGVLANLYECLYKDGRLSERFQRNFE